MMIPSAIYTTLAHTLIGGTDKTTTKSTVDTSSAVTRNTDASVSTRSLGSQAASPAEQFRDFMNSTPAEKLQEAWLARHGISKEEFAAMEPAAKQALVEQMKKEIEEEMKQANAKAPTNILT